jgi:dTDP-4-dehydrorhamnose reductase
MRVLLIGYRGQLGSDLRTAFDGEQLVLVTQEEMPVENLKQVDTVISQVRPHLILNCAAFHRVDDCESCVERAFEVNVFGVRNLALAAARTGSVLVHFSTDYVFDGAGRTPHPETELACPKCIYGVSKLSGEFLLQAVWPKHFIFRVSGLYGYAGSREKGTNFVEMMIGLARDGKPIRVVDDQVLTPTSTADVARAVRLIAGTECFGLYHLTNAGECSWYEFARTAFEYTDLRPSLMPVDSTAFPTRAKRPNYSVLDNLRLRDNGFAEMPHWRDALERYIAGRQNAGRN